jgi:hypothetical protein
MRPIGALRGAAVTAGTTAGTTATRRSIRVNRRRHLFRIIPALAALALIAVACGGSGAATAAPSSDGGKLLPAGTYSSLAFQPTVAYTLPDGWENPVDRPGYLQLRPFGSEVAGIHLFRNPLAAVQDAACTSAADTTVGTTSTDLVKWIQDRPGLTVSTPALATVGGLTGQMIDVGLKDGWNQSCPFAGGLPTVPLFNGGDAGYHWIVVGNERLRLYLLDLPGGGTLVVDVDAFDGTLISGLLDQANPIVKSLQVKTGS